MSEEKLIRTIAPEVRIVNAAEGLVDYVASDETVDCYAEVIAAKGWRFTRFEKNAPFVDSHDYWTIEKLLGRVESSMIQGRKLIERVRWAKEANPLAALGWKLTEGGFLKAVSVGFYPLRSIRPGDSDWQKTCQDMGVDDAAGVRRIFLEQEQIELSSCIIGANPNALAKAHREGAVRDEDLAKVGFGDEDMDFLQLAGPAMERDDLDPLMRTMIEREMRRIGAGQKDLRKRGNSPAPSASKPAGADADAKRQADRSEFLKQLQAL